MCWWFYKRLARTSSIDTRHRSSTQTQRMVAESVDANYTNSSAWSSAKENEFNVVFSWRAREVTSCCVVSHVCMHARDVMDCHFPFFPIELNVCHVLCNVFAAQKASQSLEDVVLQLHGCITRNPDPCATNCGWSRSRHEGQYGQCYSAGNVSVRRRRSVI